MIFNLKITFAKYSVNTFLTCVTEIEVFINIAVHCSACHSFRIRLYRADSGLKRLDRMKDLLGRKNLERRRWNKSNALSSILLLLLPTTLVASVKHHKNSVQSEEQGTQNQNFNPMELYAGDHEGVSLAHEDYGETFFSYFSAENYLGSYISDFKSQAASKYTRILVGHAR